MIVTMTPDEAKDGDVAYTWHVTDSNAHLLKAFLGKPLVETILNDVAGMVHREIPNLTILSGDQS